MNRLKPSLLPEGKAFYQNPLLQGYLMFFLIFIRYIFYEFAYYPQLDDFIQHHNYIRYEQYTGNDLSILLDAVGIFSFRPLAGLMDITLWSVLFDQMIFGLMLIALLHAFSGILFYRLLGQFFSVTPLFLVIYSLLPLGYEGTYWMSASTRVVVGLFFVSASAWYFHLFCLDGKKRYYLGFLSLQILSFGFYEQSILLSLTLTIMLMGYHFFYHQKRSVAGLSFLLSLAVFFAVTTGATSSHITEHRTKLGIFQENYWSELLPRLWEQLEQSYLEAGWHTLVTGFSRGIEILVQEEGYLYLMVSLLLCGALLLVPSPQFWANHPRNRHYYHPFVGFIVGFLLFLAPLSIFFILDNPWFSLRGTVTTFVGLALMVESLLGGLPPLSRRIFAVALALACMVASVSEITDYRDTYHHDYKAVESLYPYIKELDTQTKVGVIGLEQSYLPEQNYYFHDHVIGCTSSDWAFIGRMTEYADQILASIMPIPEATPSYYHWNKGAKEPTLFDVLYHYQPETGDVTLLSCVVVEDGVYHFFDQQEQLFAMMLEQEGIGRFYIMK